jgi:hypothetical protein
MSVTDGGNHYVMLKVFFRWDLHLSQFHGIYYTKNYLLEHKITLHKKVPQHDLKLVLLHSEWGGLGDPCLHGVIDHASYLRKMRCTRVLQRLRLHYGWRSVGQPRLDSEPPLGPLTRFSHFFSWLEISWFLIWVTFSDKRTVLYFALESVFGPGCWGPITIFCCLIRDWLLRPLATGFPLCCLLQLAGTKVEVF